MLLGLALLIQSVVVERDVQIPTLDGATICALIARPAIPHKLPTLFMYTIYVDSGTNLADVRRSVEHGYVGVIAYVRGKACSPQTPHPYVHDGVDAWAVIDWIAAQSWSDGRVGMYGGSYSGFTAWAAVNTYGSVKYVSEPLPAATEVSGLYRGHLEFTTNKRDFDLSIQVFELTTAGEYFQLPPFQQRASYRRGLSQRQLLTAGARETLDFTARVLVSRRLARGSRIVVVMGPLKWAGQQINYGSGKDVSDESMADAGVPLEIRWLEESYIELPIRR